MAGVALTLAGCTSSGGDPGASASAPVSSSAPAASSSADTGPASSAPPPSSTAPTDPGATTPGGGSGATPPPGTPACTAVTIAAVRTPGATGRSFALLSFTNTGSAACTLTGRPTAVLLDDAKQAVTSPATDADGEAVPVLLAPGATASTLLVDDASTCTADTRSAYVRVTAPGGGSSTDLPVALPPCSLSVKPVVAGTEPAP